jgi:hypothetical protein
MPEFSKDNLSNRPPELEKFSRGEPISASKLNQTISVVNRLFTGATTGRNDSKTKTAPQLYIATEDKGKWEDTLTRSNGVIKVRPIRMALYQEDNTNDDIIGEEIEMPKLYSQEIKTDDIGIAVSMGSGNLGFYAVKGTGTVDATPYLYDCDCATEDSATWKRGNPDSDNPTNPSTTNPLEGFEIKMVVGVCYDPTTGVFSKLQRTFTFDNLGMLQEMSAETRDTVTTVAGCT